MRPSRWPGTELSRSMRCERECFHYEWIDEWTQQQRDCGDIDRNLAGHRLRYRIDVCALLGQRRQISRELRFMVLIACLGGHRNRIDERLSQVASDDLGRLCYPSLFYERQANMACLHEDGNLTPVPSFMTYRRDDVFAGPPLLRDKLT